MRDRLDKLSKILIATGAVNTLSATLSSEAKDLRRLYKDLNLETSLVSGEIDRELDKTIEKLKDIIFELTNLMDNHGFTQAIDERMMKVPSEILFGDMDEIENHYDNVELPFD
jgi:type I restriction-modification system DNA methylase subunit